MKRFQEFLENGKWKRMKKSDWIVVALVGVLLLVIALPMGGTSADKAMPDGTGTTAQEMAEGGGAGTGGYSDGGTQGVAGAAQEEYVRELEEKLEGILSEMEGVGEVRVMITVSDAGERVVEKDSSASASSTSETDSGGGSRTVEESSRGEETVFVDDGQESYPYVQKENLPTIVGVAVVAEGGGNPTVVSDISDTIMALFRVEAHRIKVVKMHSGEE